ncbi:MAG: hypothetical protein ACLVJH_17360 [Faecalibacterium prausnitzii]
MSRACWASRTGSGLIFCLHAYLLLTLDYRFDGIEPVRFCSAVRRHGSHHPHPPLVLIFCGGLLLCLRGAGAGKHRAHARAGQKMAKPAALCTAWCAASWLFGLCAAWWPWLILLLPDGAAESSAYDYAGRYSYYNCGGFAR